MEAIFLTKTTGQDINEELKQNFKTFHTCNTVQ